jgi:hypothetical protein
MIEIELTDENATRGHSDSKALTSIQESAYWDLNHKSCKLGNVRHLSGEDALPGY